MGCSAQKPAATGADTAAFGEVPSLAKPGVLDQDGKAWVVVEVPDMPIEGGPAQATTPDGITLQFSVPAGYPPQTEVRAKYKPLPKPKPEPKTKAKAKAKAKGKAGEPDAKDEPSAPLAQGAATTEGSEPPGSPDGKSSQSSQPPPAQKVDAKVVHPLDKKEGLPLLPTQLPIWQGTWDWIRHDNDEVSRCTRRDAGELLVEAFNKGGYCTQQHKNSPVHAVRFQSIQKMVTGTKILSISQKLPALGQDPKFQMEFEYGKGITPMEKATTMAVQGDKPSCVNAASAYHAGGGFTTGGRHALEEAFCSQSTLFQSLKKAQELWAEGAKKGIYKNTSSSGHHQHIPTDGCILSPQVEIFRGNTDQGYFAHTSTTTVAAVISIAMYNKNRHVQDAPMDAPKAPKDYEDGVRMKFIAMAHGAALCEANVIIIPDVGCGVFQNDAKIVGKICGEVLFNYSTRFKRAVFTGNEEFYTAAFEGFKEASGTGVPPVTADTSMRSCLTALNEKAHLYCGSCSVCKRSLAQTDFSSLAILIDKQKKSHEMQFLHLDCMPRASKDFPKHTVMQLPDIAKNAQSFLNALDLNGNGYVEKEELKCVCALLWDGDIAKNPDAFEKDFEARFATWDADNSGNVDLAQIKGVAPAAGGGTAAAADPKAKAAPKAKATSMRASGTLNLGDVPKTCIEWVQVQAQKQKRTTST